MRSINIQYLLRSLKRFKGITILNMVGLTLGLATVILIATWVNHELSFDRIHENGERIYRVESLMDFTGEPFVWTVTPAPVAETIVKDFPEVEDAVQLKSGYQETIEIGDEIFIADNVYWTTEAFFRIFSFRLLSGVPETVLDDPNSLVISERIAERYFGDINPVGKTIILNNKDLLTISGVMEDTPSNSHFTVDYLVSFLHLDRTEEQLDSWGQFNYNTYILLKENVDAEQVNAKLGNYLQTKKEGSAGTLFLNPLHRIYLYRDPGFPSFDYPSDEAGPIIRIKLFGMIAIVLLLIACINFINLSTAVATERGKEIGVRKVNGASRANLLLQLFGESLMQTLIAMIVALCLATLLMPLFEKLSGKDLNITTLFMGKSFLIYFVLTLFTGLVAGLYPAVILSRFRPVKVLNDSPKDSYKGAGFRKLLVVIQFILSATFIFCILVISKQIHYMQQKELGFDDERIMVVYPKTDLPGISVLAEEIERLPGVEGVALGSSVPVNMGNWSTFDNWDGNDLGKTLKFHMMQVDDNYFDLLGFNLVEGRKIINGLPRDEVIINEAAVRQMGIIGPVGRKIRNDYNKQEFTIVGLVKDFHFRNLSEGINPVIIFKRLNWYSPKLLIKLEPGNHFNLVEDITGLIMERIPGFPVRYIFLDEQIDNYYDEEQRLNSLINVATILSILISVIGLFSLTAFTVTRRKKEMGVRKAHGASSGNLLILLNREFLILLLIAAILSLPLGYYIMSKWLESYAYHISIQPVNFIITIVIVFLIALSTMVFHTLRAANQNPADSLRVE